MHGHEVEYNAIPRLGVGGIGQGDAQCHKQGKYLVAVEFKNGGRYVHELAANIATGHASTLPAIYWLASMQEQDAVVLLRKGGESIVFLGPDGYTIKWSEGTKTLPLTMSPSGHLVIECDKYDGAQPQQAVAKKALSFGTDHSHSSKVEPATVERGHTHAAVEAP